MSRASDALPPEVPIDCPWPIVLGVDPGTRVIGYGAIVERERPCLLAAGVIRAPRELPIARRLGHILLELEEFLRRLRPRVVVVEEAFAALNVQSALRIGEGRGVVLGAAARMGAEVIQFPPAVVKKALVGNGRADKSQVAKLVAAELRLDAPPEPHDATDALALALTHLFKRAPIPRA